LLEKFKKWEIRYYDDVGVKCQHYWKIEAPNLHNNDEIDGEYCCTRGNKFFNIIMEKQKIRLLCTLFQLENIVSRLTVIKEMIIDCKDQCKVQ
jgi:hypothetical protein